MKDFKNKDQLWISVARETYKAQKLCKEYKELEKKLLTKLKEMSDEQCAIGGGFKFERIDRKGSIRYSAIEMLKGINLDAYRGDDVQSWKLYKV